MFCLGFLVGYDATDESGLATRTAANLEKENLELRDRFLSQDSSIPPTRPPTGVECDVDVEIDCKLPDGRPCESLEPPPNNQCAVGALTDTVQFSFQDCTCGPTANNQGSEASCDDAAPIPFTEPVTVSCTDEASGSIMNVRPTTVNPGEVFTVTSPGGGILPDKIECTIENDNGRILQTNVIDTSNDVSLQLKDKFGALQLEACDDFTCIETVCYDIDISNVGTNNMDITVIDFDFNGEVFNLLPQVEVNPLAPGQTTSIEVKRDVDICQAIEYCAEVVIEADPPSNMMCLDDDDYKFNIGTLPPSGSKLRHHSTEEVPQRVWTTLASLPTETQRELVAFKAGTSMSSLDDIQSTCHGNIDDRELLIEVLCWLSQELCLLPDWTRSPAQTPPPGGSPSNPSPETSPSELPSSAPSELPSQGPSPAPSELPSPGPSPAPSELPSLGPSQAPSAAPTKQCVLNLDVECTLGSGPFEGEDCETPNFEVQACQSIPTAATMLYNGGNCKQSDNGQSLEFTCEDTANGPPPTTEGEQSYIIVTDAKGSGIIYHQGFVTVGSIYHLRTPELADRFVDDQIIMIYRDENTEDPSSLLQHVQYHSPRSSDLELKNRFGASQLVEFVTEEQGNVSCFGNHSPD